MKIKIIKFLGNSGMRTIIHKLSNIISLRKLINFWFILSLQSWIRLRQFGSENKNDDDEGTKSDGKRFAGGGRRVKEEEKVRKKLRQKVD